MKKKLIPVIIVAVIIVALIAALYFLNNAPAGDTDDTAISTVGDVIYAFGSVETPKTKSAEIKNEYGSYTIAVDDPNKERQSDMVYTMTGREVYPVDVAMFSGALNNAQSIVARTLIAEAPEDLGVYGLDNPAATVTAHYTDGSSAVLLIGDYAPGSEGVYVKQAQAPAVYLVNTSYVERFLSNPTAYFDKVITGGNTEDTPITSATLGGTVREEPIEIKSNDKDPANEVIFSTHLVTSPIASDLDVDSGLKALRSAFGLTAEEVVDFGEEDGVLAKYGLDEPYATVRITSEDESIGTFTLSATQPDAQGKIYLTNSNTKLVYKMASEGQAWLNTQLVDVMSKLAILPHIDKVSTITIEGGGGETVFTLTGEGDELRVNVGDTTLDNTSFRQFYQTLLAARYNELADGPLGEDVAPVLTITYNYKDGKKADTIAFYPGTARRVFVVLNDNTPQFYGPSSYVDKVLEDIPKLLAGEPVKSIM